jgi:hypothetical protein
MAYANKDDYKKWYMANRERLIAKARAAELANPEKAAQKKREYLERHPDKRKETNRRYMKKPEVMTKQRELRAAPESRVKAKQLRDHYRDTLHDCYVRRVMAQRLGVKGSELPQTLVDAQRELMKLKRELMK